MAERIDIKDTKLLEYQIVEKGVLKIDDKELYLFEKEVWKLFATRIGWKILDEKRKKVFGECMIQFFPLEKKELISKTSLVSPLFYIKYDKTQYIELIDRSGEKIPKDLYFIILCR